MKISVRSIDYHVDRYEQAGPHAPYLVLLHGFMGSGRSFNLLTDHLTGDINLLAIDLLGHGKTGGTDNIDRYTTAEQLLDLDKILRDQFSTPFFLYGYSMGGRLALRYALQHPRFIRGIILESTHAGITSSKERAKRRERDQKWARWIKKDFDAFLSWWEQLDLFDAPSSTEDSKKWYREIQRQQVPEYMANSLQAFGQGSVLPVRDEWSNLRKPVLLAAGEYDAKYREYMKKLQRTIPAADFAMISAAAHRIHVDQPKRWSTAIKNFILKHR